MTPEAIAAVATSAQAATSAVTGTYSSSAMSGVPPVGFAMSGSLGEYAAAFGMQRPRDKYFVIVQLVTITFHTFGGLYSLPVILIQWCVVCLQLEVRPTAEIGYELFRG